MQKRLQTTTLKDQIAQKRDHWTWQKYHFSKNEHDTKIRGMVLQTIWNICRWPGKSSP